MYEYINKTQYVTKNKE